MKNNIEPWNEFMKEIDTTLQELEKERQKLNLQFAWHMKHYYTFF